jgi:hypothetical protein
METGAGGILVIRHRVANIACPMYNSTNTNNLWDRK